MVARVATAGLLGVEGFIVTVEADVGLGLPCLNVVGQATGALREASDRVRAALGNCGESLPPRRQVVNLAPSDLRKDSPGNDLAIAVALAIAHGKVSQSATEGALFWGELSLDGELRGAGGVLVVADLVRQSGYRRIYVAETQARHAAVIPDIEVIAVRHLADLFAHLRGQHELPVTPTDARPARMARDDGDLADVRGLAAARLALEIMAAGGHNLLLHGSPGVGKTMLARRAIGLFPDLSRDESIEVTKIYGVSRAVTPEALLQRPPLRAPHHTVSVAGLLGGGSPPIPGEVSLAHRGLLFLDELPELSRSCLEALREPLEEGSVTISRARHRVRFPARFQLLAAMNPCPCGYLGHPRRTCVDSPAAVARYQARVSGPLLDRIDLAVGVASSSVDSLASAPVGESTAQVRERVLDARQRSSQRFGNLRAERREGWTNANVELGRNEFDSLFSITATARKLWLELVRKRALSSRSAQRMLRVARTIADLGNSQVLDDEHVAVAAQLRVLPAVEDSSTAYGQHNPQPTSTENNP